MSADIRSGFVFRIDVDFDPGVDPVSYVKDLFLGASGGAPALRAQYKQRGGKVFTAPLLAFQRPSGRYDESALFASAELHLNLFVEKAKEALGSSPGGISPADRAVISDATVNAYTINELKTLYFDFPDTDRDGRNAFSGIMTRDIYTKAGHLTCLRDMVPDGKITLVSEQEAAMARVVPHVFRDLIQDDRFEWLVVGFDKETTKSTIERRTQAFQASFRSFLDANPLMMPWEALHAWTADRLDPAVIKDRQGAVLPYPGSNFGSRAFPALWLRSPVQVAGETGKVVGFPVLSPRYRSAFRALGFQDTIPDDVLRSAIARRVVSATIQPASTFMNALRERVSFARRAGGRATRTGPSYINGACYNPRVLIATLNIFRVYYNFFELRQYVSPLNKDEVTEAVPAATKSIAIPGSKDRLEIPKRRRRAPVRRTPAMRAGIHVAPEGETRPAPPDLSRILYQP